ncbi:MAG: XTP/dITP diphosphohydrolase [Myxococcota bacterium]|jgi:XTP/dITP diphosphohydrolase
MSQTLLVATGNAHKREEIAAMLAPWGVTVETTGDRGIASVEETGLTFVDNAILKAMSGYLAAGLSCLADDSGLAVDALDGAPGVLSARFAGEPSDDAKNNAKLIRLLADVPAAARGAAFHSALALVVPKSVASRVSDDVRGAWTKSDHPEAPDAVVFTVSGKVRGRIIDAANGTGGFGYDPYFYYVEAGKTFAEMPAAAKHAVSHRGKAMAALNDLFEALFRA